MNHQEIRSRLVEGNNRFVEDKLDGKLQNSSRRDELTSGQEPFAIVLSCADSRVVPELAFDTGLGELFVVRVAGNVANTSSIASIEYAVAHCNCNYIVVLGHQSCGAVKAAIAGGDNGKNINHLLGQIQPALDACTDHSDVPNLVKKNANISATNLLKESGILSEAVEKGTLKIAPAYYHLDSGKVEFLD